MGSHPISLRTSVSHVLPARKIYESLLSLYEPEESDSADSASQHDISYSSLPAFLYWSRFARNWDLFHRVFHASCVPVIPNSHERHIFYIPLKVLPLPWRSYNLLEWSYVVSYKAGIQIQVFDCKDHLLPTFIASWLDISRKNELF